MGSLINKTTTKPLTDRQPMCNNDVLRLLADQRGRSISEMAAHFHVTLTAIRNRLIRLTAVQSVTRQRADVTGKRGRPKYLYFITQRGTAALASAADEEIT
jgi:predicted ArsR family transcriptional regulator